MTFYARNKTERKVEDYFEGLRLEGVECPESVSGVSKDTIQRAMSLLDRATSDIVDVIFAMLDTGFPNIFNPNRPIRDGASIAHLGCYVGILMRGRRKLDREGRDYWMKPLTDLGIAEMVTYIRDEDVFALGHSTAKSSNSSYRLSEPFIELLQNFSEESFLNYFQGNELARRLRLQSELVEASLNDRGRGKHYQLIELSIEHYVPNFLEGYRVLYVDNADGDRISEEEIARMNDVGIEIIASDAFPDVILISENNEKLWFIEAVTSDGEVDDYKYQALQSFCERNNKVLAGATTTYLTWKAAASRQGRLKNLVPDSSLWIAEDPSKEFKIEVFNE